MSNAKSLKQLNAAEQALEAAKERLKQAEREHEAAFKRDCVELFRSYGLALVPSGSEGARIEVVPFAEFNPGDFE